MGVNVTDLTDLINDILKDLPHNTLEAMWDRQNSPFCQIYEDDRVQIDGGVSIQRNVMLNEQGAAKYRQMFDTDDPTVDQNQQVINVPWALLGTNYSWDEFELALKQSSKKAFIDVIQSRKMERMWGLANLFESAGWSTPTNASDTKHPYGIPYYLNLLNDGVTTGGFSGQTIRFNDGTTGTICAGLDASVNPKWRNYADTYTKVDNAFLRKLRRAKRLTQFRPAPWVQSMGDDKEGPTKGMYAPEAVVTELEDLGDKRDDANQPKELFGKVRPAFDGAVYVDQMPVIYTPDLDTFQVKGGSATVNTPQPIFAVDWSKIQPVVCEGYWMKESEPIKRSGQHTTITVYFDCAHNNLCLNRRTAGFVLHTVIVA